MKILKKYELESLYFLFLTLLLFIYKNEDIYIIFIFFALLTIVSNINIKIESKSITYFVAASFFLNFKSFKDPLIYSHAFRQTQNAISSRFISENNFSFLNPLPHIGLNTYAPFEFPFLQILSSFLQKIGVKELYTLRPLSWVIFIIFSVTYFLYLKKVTDNNLAANYFLIICAFHPLFLQYSNAFMIEFIPHIFGILACINLNNNKNFVAHIFLSMSLLSKITTGILYLLMFLLLEINDKAKNSRIIDKKQIINYLISLAPISIWLLTEEVVKDSSKFSSWLKGSQIKNWTFGNIDQYTNIQSYDAIYSRLLENFGLLYPSYYFGTFIFVILLLIEKKLILLFTVPFIFINLYLVHDYYLIAIFPIIICLLIIKLFSKYKNYRYFLLVSFLLLTNINYLLATQNDSYQNLIIKQNQLRIENYNSGLIEILNKDEFQNLNNVYIKSSFYDWNPTLFFYIDKYGLMIKDNMFLDNNKLQLSDLSSNNIDIFIFQDDNFEFTHFDTFRELMSIDGFKFLKIQKYEFSSNLPELYSENLKFFIVTPNDDGINEYMIVNTNKLEFEKQKNDFFDFING